MLFASGLNLSGENHNSTNLSNQKKKKGKGNERNVLSRKEGNVLNNDTLNTLYLRLYGVRHIVKDHSDNERGNPLPPHGLLFSISK